MVPVKKKTKIAILIASLAVFALVLAAALLLSRGAGSDRVQSGEHPLRISEYMSANTAYPNADGRICDWIECPPGWLPPHCRKRQWSRSR